VLSSIGKSKCFNGKKILLEKDLYGNRSNRRILCGTVPQRVQTGDCKGKNAEIPAQNQFQDQSVEKHARFLGKRGDGRAVPQGREAAGGSGLFFQQ
jgi:hypothetical protein